MADALGLEIISDRYSASATQTAITLDSSLDAAEFVFQCPEDIVITRLGFRHTTVAGTPFTIRISLQGVDSTGIPDGTIKSSGNAYVDHLIVSGGSGTFQWKTLGSSYSATRGEWLSMVIKYQSGTTPDGTNNVAITLGASGGLLRLAGYILSNNAGTRTRTSTKPLFGFGSASKAFGNPVTSFGGATTLTSTTQYEKGIRFTLPSGWGTSFKLRGVRAVINHSGNSTCDLVLYAPDQTTILQQITLDTDLTQAAAAGEKTFYFDESSLATLSFGSEYRLVFRFGSGTVQVISVNVSNQADWDAFPLGQNILGVTRTNTGTWTDATTTCNGFMSLILEDITVPSPGGTRVYVGG